MMEFWTVNKNLRVVEFVYSSYNICQFCLDGRLWKTPVERRSYILVESYFQILCIITITYLF